MKGKRVSYLNPIRMYMFTSFIFFLIFFALVHVNNSSSKDEALTFNGKTEQAIKSMSDKDFNDFTSSINNGVPMSRSQFSRYKDSIMLDPQLNVLTGGEKHKYASKQEYDSAVKAGNVKANWLKRYVMYRQIDLNNKYKDNKSQFTRDFINSLLHQFPIILFVSLPLVALFLKLLYIRQKQFYYVSHAIFVIHEYIFIFIVMLVSMLVSKIQDWLNWQWMGYINGLLSLLIFFYLYKSMRNFYQQRRGRTLIKYFLLTFSIFFLILILFMVFALVSIFQV